MNKQNIPRPALHAGLRFARQLIVPVTSDLPVDFCLAEQTVRNFRNLIIEMMFANNLLKKKQQHQQNANHLTLQFGEIAFDFHRKSLHPIAIKYVR